MVHDIGQASQFRVLLVSALIFLVLLVPLAVCNHPGSAALGIFVFVLTFFLPGCLLLTLLTRMPTALRTLLSPIFGIVSITTAYDILARASAPTYFPYLVVVLSAAGMILLAFETKSAPAPSGWSLQGYDTIAAGSAVALLLAPLFWRSGRFSGDEFVFYGPAGQDHLFHLTLLQRLQHHIPPDNFMVSGLRAPVYHYFDDLTLALVVRMQSALHLGTIDLFDLYYRCYPIFVYFLIGALAYRIGKQLLGTARAGTLSVLLLLGAGGLGWCFGILQTAAHALHPSAMRMSFFSEWASWDGIDAIRPLIHRPAHYHSLLICLAAINVLILPERSRRNWVVAGLLLGLMAGFNFTLAAIFGIATVLGSLIFFLRHKRDEARDLTWLALFIFIGSLPVNAAMVLSGFHDVSPGFPFRGPNLEFPSTVWGALLGRVLPHSLVPWVALIMLPIFAYGVKLFGVRAMTRLDLAGERHRGAAMVFAIAFALSFVIGTFFPYQAFGGIAIVFLQPTLWILGLFALHPIDAWLDRNRGSWGSVALWAMLGLTWVQALGAFNFSSKATFSKDTVQAMQDIRLAAAADDVVAYSSRLTERPIWGNAEESTNFSITAMTGLDGYFSSERYSISFATPGLSGSNPSDVIAQAQRLYENRHEDVSSFLKGNLADAASARLVKDHVRWIVVSGDAMEGISSSLTPWRKTRDIAVFRLPQ
jgi:hypothetical protein